MVEAGKRLKELCSLFKELQSKEVLIVIPQLRSEGQGRRKEVTEMGWMTPLGVPLTLNKNKKINLQKVCA